jgi:hypothetical protein
MAAVGSIGTSREVKEQCENMKNLLGNFFSPYLFAKTKRGKKI